MLAIRIPPQPPFAEIKKQLIFTYMKRPPRQQLAEWNTGDGDFLPLRNFQFYFFKDGAGRLGVVAGVCWGNGEFIIIIQYSDVKNAV